jgi:NTP pyrophosphatase (non-canonical NTP hydrolase)
MKRHKIGKSHKLTLDQYQAEAVLTAAVLLNPEDKVDRGIYGMMGELGELANYIEKCRYQRHEWDEEKFLEEMGDIHWYWSVLLQEKGYGAGTVAEMNLIKLRERYPQGFNPESSIRRANPFDDK